MNLKTLNYGEGKRINLGGTYKTTNGHTMTVNSIWSDKYADLVSYRTEDGKHGDTPFNSAYYWIDWS